MIRGFFGAVSEKAWWWGDLGYVRAARLRRCHKDKRDVTLCQWICHGDILSVKPCRWICNCYIYLYLIPKRTDKSTMSKESTDSSNFLRAEAELVLTEVCSQFFKTPVLPNMNMSCLPGQKGEIRKDETARIPNSTIRQSPSFTDPWWSCMDSREHYCGKKGRPRSKWLHNSWLYKCVHYVEKTGNTLQIYRGHTGPLTCLAFCDSIKGSGDNKILITGSWDQVRTTFYMRIALLTDFSRRLNFGIQTWVTDKFVDFSTSLPWS